MVPSSLTFYKRLASGSTWRQDSRSNIAGCKMPLTLRNGLLECFEKAKSRVYCSCQRGVSLIKRASSPLQVLKELIKSGNSLLVRS